MSIVPQLIINSLIAGAIYTLVAVSFDFIFGVTKFFNLAHGVIAAIGGYAVLFLANTRHVNLSMSILVGILAAGLIGFGLDKLVYAPLRKKKSSNMIFLVASLGAFTTIQAVIAILFTSQFRTLSAGPGLQNVYQIFGASLTKTQLWIMIAGVALSAGLALLLPQTKFGKVIRAVSDDAEVAKMVGINTEKIIGYAFFIGSAVMGLTGILVGFDTGLEPTMGFTLLLKGMVAAIVGGIGNLYGAVLGSLLLGFAENFGIWKLSGEWKDTIAFVLLIVFLIFRPRGIVQS